MYMVGRTKYGVKPRVNNVIFRQSKNTPGDFSEKISFLHICVVYFIGSEIPELLWGTVFSKGGDADVR